MRTRLLLPLLALAFAAPSARSAVVVFANYTAEPIEFTIAEKGEKPRAHKIGANDVIAIHATGPGAVGFRTKGGAHSFEVEVYHAYLFLPDPAKPGEVLFEGVELPDKAPERDARPELNPVPRNPVVKIPVTLLVDDEELRAEQAWKDELRARFDEVAGIIEKATGVRLELAGFDTWKSDPEAKNLSELLAHFEKAVKVKPGTLAVGYSSRKIDEKVDPAFGVARGLRGRHVLLREWRPKSEPERVEVLAHYLALALGAGGTPDPGSAMRAKLGDGYLLRAGAVLRLDPLNALVLNLWAEERRRDPVVTFETMLPHYRARLTRVYKAILKANPGDPQAVEYLNELDRLSGKRPDPGVMNPQPRPGPNIAARDDLARRVIRAVIERAKRNTGPGALTGDALTNAYVKAAAEAALTQPSPEMVSAFLIGLGIALDDTDALQNDGATAGFVRDLESAEDRKARLAVLGNPTLGGRRDLCRRFFVGAGACELLTPDPAEQAAVSRALFDMHRVQGLSFAVLAAECAGIAFGQACQDDPERLRELTAKLTVRAFLPSLDGLRNGVSKEKFTELYGDSQDERFQAVVADIRKRIAALAVLK